MLIRITNRCTMGCRHCFIDASCLTGEHMTSDTFEQALSFGKKIGSNVVLLSGGEPLEHPEFDRFARQAREFFLMVIVTSNGLFAFDDEKYKKVQRLIQDGRGRIVVQVTNDPRYYPRNLDLIQHKFEGFGFSYENHLRQLLPCRRTRMNGLSPNRMFPTCVNLRANVRNQPIEFVIPALEAHGRPCTPSIDPDGTVRAGEMDTCHVVGNVFQNKHTIRHHLASMSCNTCGLRNNLTSQQQDIVGEQPE